MEGGVLEEVGVGDAGAEENGAEVLGRLMPCYMTCWVIAARTAVLDATRGRLQGELGITAGEVDSIIRLVRSQLDLSLRELD